MLIRRCLLMVISWIPKIFPSNRSKSASQHTLRFSQPVTQRSWRKLMSPLDVCTFSVGPPPFSLPSAEYDFEPQSPSL